MGRCDCVYIAPEILATGHRCNQCRAATEAVAALEQVKDTLEYLDGKGWPVFGLIARSETLLMDLRVAASGKGPPPMKGGLKLVK